MRNIEMRLICYRCDRYRSISYADGSGGIGCRTKDGIYTDIRNLDSCPLGKSADKTNNVHAGDVLPVLAKLYSLTSVEACQLPLSQIVQENIGPSMKGKRVLVAAAIKDLKILKVVHKEGKSYTYRWMLKKCGPPSLELAIKVVDKVVELTQVMIAVRHGLKKRKGSTVFTLVKKPTRCVTCKLNAIDGCMDITKVLGISCREYDINTIELEK